MKAITIRQPWASLIAAGVKTIDTRPRPTRYRGRVAIHAAKRAPLDRQIGVRFDGEHFVDYGLHPSLPDGHGWLVRGDTTGLYAPAPLGAVVASAVLTDCVPIVAGNTDDCGYPPKRVELWDDGELWLVDETQPEDLDADDLGQTSHITHQLPYRDFSPGRWALLLDDIAPTTDRCPWCWGQEVKAYCPACGHSGRCDPVPARGRGGQWEWTP